ncbi:MAG: beta-propeller fold lactonase family protein, partial [Saprospiraceae bacterium]|nr:beta-propeller fold lactonase family protein [Saprospiraceae bacterium]
MQFSRMFFSFALALCLAWLGCDSADSDPTPDVFPFNPDTLDFSTIESFDYGDYVQPLLAYRNIFGVDEDDPLDRLNDYSWDALFGENNGAHGTIIPFSADLSLLILCADGRCADPDAAFSNLETLQDDEVDFLRGWIEDGAKSLSDTIPFSDAEALIYVCNQMANRVAIVDAERMQVIRYVDMMALGEGMMTKPHHTAVEPDGSAWYVNLIDGDGGTPGGSILKLSTDLNMDPSNPSYVISREVPDGTETFTTPGMMWLDGTSDRLIVGRSFAAPATSTGIASVNREDMQITEYATLDVMHPHAIGVSTNGRWILTGSLDGNNRIIVLDAETGDLVDQLNITGVHQAFVQFGVSPDGTTVVVTSQLAAKVLFFTLDAETGDLEPDGEVATGEQPWHPIFSPDGATLYIPNRFGHSVTV